MQAAILSARAVNNVASLSLATIALIISIRVK
jgi:hypothetical protein